MKKRHLFIFTIVAIFSFTATFLPAEKLFSENEPEETMAENQDVKTIAFLYDGEDKDLMEKADVIEKEILQLAEGRYSVKFIDSVSGEFNKSIIKEELAKLLNDDNVDLIITLGFKTALVVVSEKELPKPVILADIFDIEIFDFPYKDGASGRENLNYLATRYKVKNNIDTFRKVVDFEKLHLLLDGIYLDEAEAVIEKSGNLGVEVVIVPYEDTSGATLEAVREEKPEAIYFLRSVLFPDEYNKEIIQGLIEMKIPTFSHIGIEDVEEGILVGLVPKHYTKFARRIALNADRIFKGENAGEISVLFDADYRFVVNALTARKIGISLPFEVLFDAEILNFWEDWGESLTIVEAVDEALKNNVNFLIRDQDIRKAKKEHLIQWSGYLPTVKYLLDFEVNDSETARWSAGATPKWYLKNRFTLSQLVFSDPVFTDIINSRRQIDIERLNKKAQVLDIINQASTAYLEYLITKALLKVENDNLKSSQHNLEMARKRHKIGVGGKEEIYRWESEVADSQSNILKAGSNVMTARITLNQLMNHPQDKPFQEEDAGLEITKYYIGGEAFKDFVKNPKILNIFIDFMVEKSFENSPELQALGVSINQQKATKGTAARKFFLPEATLDGYLDHQLRKKYYSAIPENKHDDWFLGIKLTYPIFEGGKRGFDYDKQSAELDRLLFTKELTQQFTELDVRKAANNIFYSYPNINLSHEAMVSASENYRIVEDKYAKGTASITDLIDAQTQKFNRESQAVIAVYQFLQDLTAFDRAISEFHFMISEEEKAVWAEELRVYFADRGIDITL